MVTYLLINFLVALIDRLKTTPTLTHMSIMIVAGYSVNMLNGKVDMQRPFKLYPRIVCPFDFR